MESGICLGCEMSVNDYRTPPTTELFTVQPGSTEFSATYVFGNEDHTLGNALRFALSLKPETEFVGYSCPHPYEPKMNIRLQTKGISAISALKSGLDELEEVANLMDEAFLMALTDFKKKK